MLVSLTSESIKNAKNLTIYGEDFTLDEGMIYYGRLSSDGKNYTFYPNTTYASLGEESKTLSIFVGKVIPSTVKNVTAKLTVFGLSVYCKGSGQYNSMIINCKCASSKFEFINKYMNQSFFAIAGEFSFAASVGKDGTEYDPRPELWVNDSSLAGFLPNNSKSTETSKTQNKKSKNTEEIPF